MSLFLPHDLMSKVCKFLASCARVLVAFPSLRGIPKSFHFLQGGGAGRPAITRQLLLDEAETPLKLSVGKPDGCFRISCDMAGKIGGGEQQIADFPGDRGGVPGIERGFDLVGLLTNFFDD